MARCKLFRDGDQELVEYLRVCPVLGVCVRMSLGFDESVLERKVVC